MTTKKRELPKTESMEEARRNFPHFEKYLRGWSEKGKPIPDYHFELDRSFSGMDSPNLIYPVGNPMFVHVHSEPDGMKYDIIQPILTQEEKDLNEKILDRMVELASSLPVPEDNSEMEEILVDLLNEIVDVKGREKSITETVNNLFGSKIKIEKEVYEKLKYYLIRNRIGYSKLEPLFHDPWLEDLHCVGVGAMSLIHKLFGMCNSNLTFKNDYELNTYMLETTERVERPVSSRHSVVDAVMPDGSRSNFIYGRDVSLEGSSFTIRKFSEVPISITQLLAWNTLNSQMAAYLWLALEHGMNIFVCGETAAGKTTTLNAMTAFIKHDAKVYSVENTPEVTMPHEIWQHLVTREAGKDSDVTYLDLLLAALRSRPDYIIVGEIRGEEGNVAFQAMQTGHPVTSTFHAGNINSLIQRLTNQPISVPITSVDNLNIVVFQSAVWQNGKMLRRVTNMQEIERYYRPQEKMINREVFSWNPSSDEFNFKGMYNSYILETKIATLLGYADTRKIYDDMAERRKILDKMVELEIFEYFKVFNIIKKYYIGGVAALPFEL
ncbi:MAG: type II/IV secretion system ATPase subunit [Candidatus Woesearchaeota archaeon]